MSFQARKRIATMWSLMTHQRTYNGVWAVCWDIFWADWKLWCADLHLSGQQISTKTSQLLNISCFFLLQSLRTMARRQKVTKLSKAANFLCVYTRIVQDANPPPELWKVKAERFENNIYLGEVKRWVSTDERQIETIWYLITPQKLTVVSG